MEISLIAPAKINLFLAVGAVLPNGLHQITSMLQTIDLADELKCFAADELEVDCSLPGLSGESNLVYKAAGFLKSNFNVRDGARIDVIKRIPVAAGLGGGSSDAAAALLILNKFWQLNLSPNVLNEIAAQLGADVPFFLHGGTQLAEGYGEQLSTLDGGCLEKVFFVLANPGIQLLAGDVYRHFDRMRPHGKLSEDKILMSMKKNDIRSLAGNMANDLESAATALCPEIAGLKQSALESGALAAIVSGSGPTIVAVAESREKAEEIAGPLSKIAPFVAVSRALHL